MFQIFAWKLLMLGAWGIDEFMDGMAHDRQAGEAAGKNGAAHRREIFFQSVSLVEIKCHISTVSARDWMGIQ
jgi:hypothetical protein